MEVFSLAAYTEMAEGQYLQALSLTACAGLQDGVKDGVITATLLLCACSLHTAASK